MPLLTGKYLDLATRLSNTDDAPGMKYGELLLELGSPGAVLQFLDVIYVTMEHLEKQAMERGLRFNDNHPTLDQPESEDYTEGQYRLLAWDGGFDLAEVTVNGLSVGPILIFSGNEGPSGYGKTVYRPVGYTDYIVWHRCNTLTLYEHGFDHAPDQVIEVTIGVLQLEDFIAWLQKQPCTIKEAKRDLFTHTYKLEVSAADYDKVSTELTYRSSINPHHAFKDNPYE